MIKDIMERKDFSNSDMAINDFRFNDAIGVYDAILELKAWAGGHVLRLFFTFSDGRHIIAPVYPWQSYLGFCEMPLGSKVRLTYTENIRGIYLTEAEVI